MARILCTWEIGDGHGHVRNLIAVADILRASGHSVVFAVPVNQVTAIKLLQSLGYIVSTFILPMFPSINQYLSPLAIYRAASYVDVIGLHAFDSADRLGPFVERYKELMKHTDVVLAETAPVAMFAANLARVPCIAIGTSFGLPELSKGFDLYPQLDYYANTPLFEESQLLVNATIVADHTLASLAKAMLPKRIIPFCYPALDQYGHQRSSQHIGVGPIWSFTPIKIADGIRGFAYLQKAHPSINEMVSAIRMSGIPFTVYVRGGKYTSSGNMTVLEEFDLSTQLLASTFVVHHGSAGMAQAAMSAGIPQICFPYHIENTNNAYRLQMLGISKAIGHQQPEQYMEFLLDGVKAQASAAQVVASQLASHSKQFPGAIVAAAAVEDLLGSR